MGSKNTFLGDTHHQQGKRPPLDPGLPLLGHVFSLYQDMLQSVDFLQQKHQTSAIEVGIAMQRYVLLFGPDANQMVLHNKNDAFSNAGGWEHFIGKVFPGAIMGMDGDHHRYQRRIMQQAFKKPVLVQYTSAMNTIGNRQFDRWAARIQQTPTDVQPFLVYDEVKDLLMQFAADIFLGIKDSDNTDAMVKHFVSCVEASLALIRTSIPPLKMWKGIQGRKQLVKMFSGMIVEKRATNSPDFFSQFCHAVSEEGERYTDQEVIDHMIFLMLAAHDTTATVLTAIFYNLAKHPEWAQELREEVSQFGDRPLDYDDMEKLQKLSWTMKECMRLYPSLPSIPRKLTKDIEFDGYQLKAGQVVSIFPIHTHQDPSIWTNPQSFDPMRFSPERAEHTQHRFCYVPFGGGAHMCIGQHFAELQVKSIMSQILRRFTWSVPENYVMPFQAAPIGKPRDGLPIDLRSIH